MPEAEVAVVDFGTGNLYNVERALFHVGLRARTTSSPADVLGARGVVLPGVGAMRDAMQALDESGLGDALRKVAERGTPLFGVCLGMQLLMEHGNEFGPHTGLGIIPGSVVQFKTERGLKVPHIGWNSVVRPDQAPDRWLHTPLEGLPRKVYQYFVHSYYVEPSDLNLVAGVTTYGGQEFCSVLSRHNVFGCQFHPERSGPTGLRMYQRFARMVSRS